MDGAGLSAFALTRLLTTPQRNRESGRDRPTMKEEDHQTTAADPTLMAA